MAVTIAYLNPVTGATAPTAAQSLLSSEVIADVTATSDADTTATITHNFGSTAAELANGFPVVSVVPILSQALTTLSAWAVTAIATNSITLTKLTSTGSGNAAAQIRVSIRKPHSLVR